MDISQTVTAVVAAFAAIVSTAALILQRRDKRERETTRCEVEVGLFDMVEHVVGERTLQIVHVNLINHGEHQVRWDGVAFHKQGGGPDEWIVPTTYAYGPRFPVTVPSRNAADVTFDGRSLEEAGLDWEQPVHVRAWTSRGERFHSAEKPLSL